MPGEDSERIRQIITSKWAFAEKGDYYGLLGVGRDASTDEVKRAYRQLVKHIHPDRVTGVDLQDLRPRVAELFRLVTDAHAALGDPKARADFDAGRRKALVPGGAAAAKVSSNVDEAAKIAFHKGSVMLTKRDWAQAEGFFREAAETRPDVARYWQSLGWAVFNNAEARDEATRLEEARAAYDKALELNEDDPQTHYNLGLYHKARGDSRQSRQEFEKAVGLRSNFVDAKRELRLMEMRRKNEAEKEATQGGFFAKIMAALKKPR